MAHEDGSHDVLDAAFAGLLDPFSPEEFFTQWYDRQYLYIPGDKEKFRQLCSLEQLQELIARGAPWKGQRPPEVYYCGQMIATDDLQYGFTNMDGYSAARPRLDRLESLFQKGATIVCYSMHNYVARIDDVCRVVSGALNAEVEAHLVYSKMGKKGLASHYDSTDVFVLQLEGGKIWNLWDHRVTNPIGGLGARVELDPDSKFEQAYLSPGDMLYIPRGVFHDAVAATDESLHISVVAKVPTNFDFLSSLLMSALSCDEVRAYFPHLNRARSGVSLEQSVAELMDVVSALSQSPELIGDFLTEVNLKAQKTGATTSLDLQRL